jgi:hypothetical protein
MPIPASRPKAKEPITTSGVNHLLRLTRQASPETGQRRDAMRREDFLYVLKGRAARAPGHEAESSSPPNQLVDARRATVGAAITYAARVVVIS